MAIYPNRKPIPAAVRAEVYERAAGRCEDCGCVGRLELHHLTYTIDFPGDIFGYESAEDLAALCRECHKERHMLWGVFYADIDELEDTLSSFDDEMSKD